MLELFATVFIWGLSFALSKKALNVFSPFELVAFRLTLGALTAGALSQIFREKPASGNLGSKKVWTMAFILGLFEFAGTYILYTWSLSYLPSGVVGTLTLLTPTLTFLVGLIFKTNPGSWRNLGATLLSILGAGLCFPLFKIFSGLSISDGAVFGFLLLMVSNLAFAVGNVLITKWDRAGHWQQTQTVKGLLCGALAAILIASFTPGTPLVNMTHLQAWILPVYLGVVATGLGFWLWNRGVRKVSALPASLIGNFKGPLSVFWGAFLLHESFDLKFIAGLILLFISTQIISLKPAVKS